MNIYRKLLGPPFIWGLNKVGYTIRPNKQPCEIEIADATKEGVFSVLHGMNSVVTIEDPIVVAVDIGLCRDAYGFGFGEDGWHPLTETVKGYVKSGNREYKESFLETFFRTFQPRSASDALGVKGSSILDYTDAMGWVTPWSAYGIEEAIRRKKRILRSESIEHGLHEVLDSDDGYLHFGPVSSALGMFEMKRLIDTYDSIKGAGYNRARMSEDITIQVIRSDSQERYIVSTGRHRLASLSALKQRTVPVRLRLTPLPVMDIKDMPYWRHVRNGVYPMNSAMAYVQQLFEDNGWRRAASLGLI